MRLGDPMFVELNAQWKVHVGTHMKTHLTSKHLKPSTMQKVG